MKIVGTPGNLDHFDNMSLIDNDIFAITLELDIQYPKDDIMDDFDELRTKTKEQIEVMNAFLEGKEIEFNDEDLGARWLTCSYPIWNWADFVYRVKGIPDVIDWNHVNPKYNYMARDKNGDVYLYTNKPFTDRGSSCWCRADSSVVVVQVLDTFVSYNRGNLPWEESLVGRPTI